MKPLTKKSKTIKPLTNLLLTLLMLVLLSSCDSNLKPETQGKKMATFFTNTNKQPQLQTELGQDFFKWLVSAINNRKIQMNTDQAKVHIVTYKNNKALFLVSPRIFKDYDTHQWARIQKQFGRLRLNLKTHTNENIWQVQTITYRLSKKPSRIQGYLVNP